jgi:hypothetical protein
MLFLRSRNAPVATVTGVSQGDRGIGFQFPRGAKRNSLLYIVKTGLRAQFIVGCALFVTSRSSQTWPARLPDKSTVKVNMLKWLKAVA